MKQKISILLFMIAFAFVASAQTIGDYIDVVYLKNGSKIKGIIVEQVPGKTVKIQTKDGSQYVYSMAEVEKFTREGITSKTDSKKNSKDKLPYMDNFKKKRKGYFFNASLLGSISTGGIRITNGYRFNRFANFGFALGIESIHTNSSQIPVLTLHLNYSGEILNKRITPFYQLELGYGFSLSRHDNFSTIYYSDEQIPENYDFQINYGGPMAGLALGAKFYTKRKVNFSLALDTRFTSNFNDSHISFINEEGNKNTALHKSLFVLPTIGARFSIGF